MLLFSWFKCTNCANFDRLSSPNKSSTPPRSSSLLPFDPLMKHLKQCHSLGSERRPSRAACNQKVKVLNCGASNMRSSSVSHWVSLPCPPFSSGAAEQKQQKCWKAEVLSAEVFRVWRRSVGCSCRTGLKCPGLHCRFSACCSGDAVYSSLHTSFLNKDVATVTSAACFWTSESSAHWWLPSWLVVISLRSAFIHWFVSGHKYYCLFSLSMNFPAWSHVHKHVKCPGAVRNLDCK